MRELTERQLKKSGIEENRRKILFQRESSGSSFITVTNVEVSADLKNATVYITAFSQSKEVAALDFAKRMRGDSTQLISRNIYQSE